MGESVERLKATPHDSNVDTYRAALVQARTDLAEAEARRAKILEELAVVYTQIHRLMNVINAFEQQFGEPGTDFSELRAERQAFLKLRIKEARKSSVRAQKPPPQ